MTKLIVAFRNFAKVPKNCCLPNHFTLRLTENMIGCKSSCVGDVYLQKLSFMFRPNCRLGSVRNCDLTAKLVEYNHQSSNQGNGDYGILFLVLCLVTPWVCRIYKYHIGLQRCEEVVFTRRDNMWFRRTGTVHHRTAFETLKWSQRCDSRQSVIWRCNMYFHSKYPML